MSSFSRELSRSTKFLMNYASIFEYFVKENILKSLSETFLKIFKYVHIEASKFLEF
jgi:Na+-translocating ferredoxin:NAD+ oxidoreductase RnfA subunit